MSSSLISVVDDDPSVRSAIGRLLRSFGYQVRMFDSAEAFLGSPERSLSACIVCDVQMPGISGLGMQAQMLADGDVAQIVFVTAFPDERMQSQAVAGGAAGFLSKPFDVEELVRLIRGVVSEPSL